MTFLSFQTFQTNQVLDCLLNIPKLHVSQTLVPHFVASRCIKSRPIHFFGLQIEKIRWLTNKLNLVLIILFLIFGQRIQSADVWIIVQDHLNFSLLAAFPPIRSWWNPRTSKAGTEKLALASPSKRYATARVYGGRCLVLQGDKGMASQRPRTRTDDSDLPIRPDRRSFQLL